MDIIMYLLGIYVITVYTIILIYIYILVQLYNYIEIKDLEKTLPIPINLPRC
jgi:hypothetical protein